MNYNCVHVCKGKQNSSVRTREAQSILKKVANDNDVSVIAERQKKQRIELLAGFPHLNSSPEKSFKPTLLTFFTGHWFFPKERFPPNSTFHHVDSLCEVDHNFGCIGGNHDFLKLPRHDCVSPNTVPPLKMMTAFSESFSESAFFRSGKCTRGHGRRVALESSDSGHVTLGTAPRMNGPGLPFKKPMAVSDDSWTTITKMARCTSKLAKKHFFKDVLAGVKAANGLGGHMATAAKEGTDGDAWPSMAIGKNVTLNSHTDDDFFQVLLQHHPNLPTATNTVQSTISLLFTLSFPRWDMPLLCILETF